VHPIASLRLPVRKNFSVKNKTRRLRHPCFQQFDLNPATMTLAGKSLFKLIVVLPRCPLALGSCSSEVQFGFFQFGHAITFTIFGLSLDLGVQCTSNNMGVPPALPGWQ
jgi:hypothetical protein